MIDSRIQKYLIQDDLNEYDNYEESYEDSVSYAYSLPHPLLLIAGALAALSSLAGLIIFIYITLIQ